MCNNNDIINESKPIFAFSIPTSYLVLSIKHNISLPTVNEIKDYASWDHQGKIRGKEDD